MTVAPRLQFGLQFIPVRQRSPEYAHAFCPAARTPMNPRERTPLKLLIRGLGVEEVQEQGAGQQQRFNAPLATGVIGRCG
jgi:hypothetical protein